MFNWFCALPPALPTPLPDPASLVRRGAPGNDAPSDILPALPVHCATVQRGSITVRSTRPAECHARTIHAPPANRGVLTYTTHGDTDEVRGGGPCATRLSPHPCLGAHFPTLLPPQVPGSSRHKSGMRARLHPPTPDDGTGRCESGHGTLRPALHPRCSPGDLPHGEPSLSAPPGQVQPHHESYRDHVHRTRNKASEITRPGL